MATVTEIAPFTNEPLLDWSDPENVRAWSRPSPSSGTSSAGPTPS
jgi:hypothetical protein